MDDPVRIMDERAAKAGPRGPYRKRRISNRCTARPAALCMSPRENLYCEVPAAAGYGDKRGMK